MHRIFVGFDSREPSAYDVAVHSLRKHSLAPLLIEPLVLNRLEQQRLITRPRVVRDGRMYDLISQAHMSTEFAITRFLPPLLAQDGWVMFADSDVVALHDVGELFAQRDDSKAVMVVKHAQQGGEAVKMDNQVQYYYSRKNWSSVMLFNCSHPANDALTLEMVNTLPGRDLHAFCWLNDQHIGELSASWNWLVNVEMPALKPKLAHFTLGGPWFENWSSRPYDDIWLAAAKEAGVQILSGGKAAAKEKQA